MRLRRETGDFQITINSENAVNTIRKGLSAEDFVGELVNVNGTYEVVNSANDTETGAEFKTNSFTLTYTKATGVITAQEGGSGSGSGAGGGKEEFDFKAFCQEYGEMIASAEEPSLDLLRIANEVPQNLTIHCTANAGSGSIVADEDYGDNFRDVLNALLVNGGRTVTLDVDMAVGEGIVLRSYIGPLYLDMNSSSPLPKYYNLMANGNQLASQIYTQNGRTFTPDTLKSIAWSNNEA